MQPPTTSAPAAGQLRGDEDELYRRHHRDLQSAVARTVNAPRELIEDSCQFAWMTLLATQPERTSIAGWLYVVATRHARRLCALDRRAARLEDLGHPTGWESVIADALSLEDVVEAHEALAILAGLPERQRADLTLLVAGFSYEEIRELTGGRTLTNVSKHLAKARAHIRLARLRRSAGR